MTIAIDCSECGQSYKLKDELAGKKIRCKGCQAPIEVPAADDDWDETPEPEAPKKSGGKKGGKKSGKAKKKSGGGNGALLWVGLGVGGLVLVGGLIWGVLAFLPKSDDQSVEPVAAGDTPAVPAVQDFNWEEFKLPDGTASARFPGPVTSGQLPNDAVGHVYTLEGMIFGLSDPMSGEVPDNLLDTMLAGSVQTEAQFNPRIETINGTRFFRKSLTLEGQLTTEQATVVHNKRMYVVLVSKLGPEVTLDPARTSYFINSIEFH